jgi:hypothetical protein
LLPDEAPAILAEEENVQRRARTSSQRHKAFGSDRRSRLTPLDRAILRGEIRRVSAGRFTS